MPEPTPRPWQVGRANGAMIRIKPAGLEGPYIAGVRFSDNPMATRDIADANADLIVEAVNSHDKLVAVRDATIEFLKWRLWMEEPCLSHPSHRINEFADKVQSILGVELEEYT